MNGGPISGDDGEFLFSGQAWEDARRELATALRNPTLTWSQAIARVEQLARADQAARTPAAPVRQCSATSGGDRCDRAAGHEGKHWCADPQFSWGFGPLHLSDVVGGGL